MVLFCVNDLDRVLLLSAMESIQNRVNHFVGCFGLLHVTLNAGEKKRIWLDAQCPEAFDVISISFWNAKSPNQIWIDDLSISTLE
jgi:hypothetical protein